MELSNGAKSKLKVNGSELIAVLTDKGELPWGLSLNWKVFVFL